MTGPRELDARDASIAQLIALGRDREAVDAATRGSRRILAGASRQHVDDEGGAMDGVQQLDEIVPALGSLVDRIRPDQLDGATPCAAFTTAGVLEHMIAGATMFAPAFRGEPAPASSALPAPAPVQERWRRAMDELSAATHAAGAQDRMIASPFGEVRGSSFARYVAFDGLVHGWDIATATGQRFAPRDELVAEVAHFARGLLQPPMRDGDTFAAETTPPPGASPLECLVAFTGRQITHDKETTP